MIRIDRLSKRFKKQTVLKQIDLTFGKGEVVSLIGPNGSGKTTLIKSILGLVKPDSGTIYFDDRPIGDSVDYRKQIGYMPQVGRYPDNMLIRQLFAMLKELRKEQAPIDETLYYKLGLDTIPDKAMRNLSGGTRQKVSAAIAFLFDPGVLILDEPTAGLDPLSTEILKEKIREEKEKGKLILITSHVLSDLEELTSHVIYLHEGNILVNRTLPELQHQTGEKKLGKIIAHLMKQGLHDRQFVYVKA